MLLPSVMLLLALLLQPACLLYTRMVMRSAASECARTLATAASGDEEACKRFVLRRLKAVPEVSVFHVGGESDWDVSLSYAEGGQTVTSALASDGRTRVDWLVETHPDADHIGGLPDVIRANDIGSVWAPRCNHSTHAYTRFLEAVAAKNLQIDEAYAGRQIASGDGYAIDVTWPRQGATYSDSNDCSVVILVTYGQNTFLFTGDAPVEALEQCTTGHVDVLKASHHYRHRQFLNGFKS